MDHQDDPRLSATGAGAVPASGRRRTRSFRVPLLVAGALVGGALGGAGGLTLAAAGPWQSGWHHGERLERLQTMAKRTLDAIGATSTQEDKIHDIIGTAFAGVAASPREELRKEVLDLLRAPTIDRAAAEKLRADQIAAIDAKSKLAVGAALDAAEQLTPDQRTKLADRLTAMMDRHRGWGGHHGGWGGPRDGGGNRPGGHPMDDGPGNDDNPGDKG